MLWLAFLYWALALCIAVFFNSIGRFMKKTGETEELRKIGERVAKLFGMVENIVWMVLIIGLLYLAGANLVGAV